MQIVVSPFQGLVFVILVTQGGAARLAPLRSALGWYVEAPSGRILRWFARGELRPFIDV